MQYFHAHRLWRDLRDFVKQYRPRPALTNAGARQNPRSSRHSCHSRNLRRLAARRKIAVAIEGTAIAFMIER